MFIGHFAIALGAKKFAPKTSLGTLFIAAQFVDLLWPVFILLSIEKVKVVPGITVVTPLDFIHYPYSHSLLAVLVWAGLLSLVYWSRTRYAMGTLVICLTVLSHWVLDLISHRPDLPIYPGGSTMVGFGLWNSLYGTLLIESALFIACVALYLKTTRALDKTGSIAFWGLVALQSIIYLGNTFGPPPPDYPKTIAVVGLTMWLLVWWAYWIDRHRATA